MKVTIYTINDCKFSQTEKDYLKKNNIAFEEKNLETNRDFLTEMLSISDNFAGTPVTQIEKDDGTKVILKGFTEQEFATELGLQASMAQDAKEETATPTENAVQSEPKTEPVIESLSDNSSSMPTPAEPSPASPAPAPMEEPKPVSDDTPKPTTPDANQAENVTPEPVIPPSGGMDSAYQTKPISLSDNSSMPSMDTSDKSPSPMPPSSLSGMNSGDITPPQVSEPPISPVNEPQPADMSPAPQTPANPAPMSNDAQPTPAPDAMQPQVTPDAPQPAPTQDPLNSVLQNLQTQVQNPATPGRPTETTK